MNSNFLFVPLHTHQTLLVHKNLTFYLKNLKINELHVLISVFSALSLTTSHLIWCVTIILFIHHFFYVSLVASKIKCQDACRWLAHVKWMRSMQNWKTKMFGNWGVQFKTIDFFEYSHVSVFMCNNQSFPFFYYFNFCLFLYTDFLIKIIYVL